MSNADDSDQFKGDGSSIPPENVQNQQNSTGSASENPETRQSHSAEEDFPNPEAQSPPNSTIVALENQDSVLGEGLPDSVEKDQKSVPLNQDIELEDLPQPEKSSQEITHANPEVLAGDSDVPTTGTGPEPIDVEDDGEANTTARSSLQFSFTTPLKSLPPLKDIEPITTPKSFNVARDNADVLAQGSSPEFQNILGSVVEHEDEEQSNDLDLTSLASHLHVSLDSLKGLDTDTLKSMQRKILEANELRSQLTIASINLEKTLLIQEKKSRLLKEHLKSVESELTEARAKITDFETDSRQQQQELANYRRNNSESEKTSLKLEAENDKLKRELQQSIDSKNDEILRLSSTIDKMMGSSIEESTKVNELVQELNTVRNDKFKFQLELSKASNELAYSRGQKEWYETELKDVQKRYTELVQRHEGEYIINKTKLSKAESTAKELQKITEEQKHEISVIQTNNKQLSKEIADHKLENLNKLRSIQTELQNKEQVLELTQAQTIERQQRIEQLESYIEDLNAEMEKSVATIKEKDQAVLELKETLKRTESVLDDELRKETALPKLSSEAESLAAKNPNGMLLLILYQEFSSLKKQLVLEKLQKQKLAHQLEAFIAELEQKKPTISGYRDQLKLYQSQLKDAYSLAEEIRAEKIDVERQNRKLEASKIALENELVAMKQLSRDLGNQLCYYLIHMKVKETPDGQPLSITERKAIENILQKTGGNKPIEEEESDSDALISSRLITFKDIIDLQQRNQELITVVRQLSKQLEAKEASLLESVAVDEAKEAILALQEEIERISGHLEATKKERDALREINGRGDGTYGNKYLDELNKDLRKQLAESEKLQKNLKSTYEKQILSFNEKISKLTEKKNEVSLQNLQLQHTIALGESRYANLKQVLESTKKELSLLQNDSKFWKEQTAKQEKSLVESTTNLRKIEIEILTFRAENSSLKSDKVTWGQIEKHLYEEIDQLRKDKVQLSEFVSNLQTLFKERENLSKDLEDRLNQQLESYNQLQERLNQKEERISILTSQAELSIKSQNSNLDQLQEILELLANNKRILGEKEGTILQLKGHITQLESDLKSLSELQQKLVEKAMTEVGSGDFNDVNMKIELDSLRNDLQIAQRQLDEFSEIAKVSEEALVNSTKAFEEYRSEIETERNAILADKLAVQKERDAIKEQMEKLQDSITIDKNTYENQLKETKVQLQEATVRANAYDQLQTDYEKKLSAIKEDLETQSKLASDAQSKYNDQFVQNEYLMEEVTRLKKAVEESNGNLQSVQKDLQTKSYELSSTLDKLESSKLSVDDELSKLNARVVELQNQNQILLNQIQLNNEPGNSEIGGIDEGQSLEVVAFLRREKEAAEMKLGVAVEEQKMLEQKLRHISTDLEHTKSSLRKAESSLNEVSESKTEHGKIMEQIEQLNILRESNSTLRSELVSALREVERLREELKSYREEISELKKTVANLTTQKELQEQSISFAKEEAERYKNLTKSESNGNGIEISELRSNLTQKDLLIAQKSSELDALTKELEITKSKLTESIDAMSKKSQEHENLNKEYNSLNERFVKLKSEAQEKLNRRRDELRQANANIEKLNASLKEAAPVGGFDDLQLRIDELVKEKLNLEEQVRVSSDNLSKLKTQHEVKQKQLNGQIEKLQQSQGEASNGAVDSEALKQEHEKAIAKLKEDFAHDLENARAETKKLSEKTTELRVKMLNKKISKLTQQLKSQGSPSKAQTPAGDNVPNQAGTAQKRPADVDGDVSNKKPKEA